MKKIRVKHFFILYRYVVFTIKLIVSFIFSLFIKKKNYWLICERGTDARDNGLYFFRFMRQHHPEIETFYLISKDSVDRNRLENYSQWIINYKSFKHYLYIWKADVLISTHIHGFSPEPVLSRYYQRKTKIYGNKFLISLKHGITKDYLPVLKYEMAQLDLVIAGAYPEYLYLKENYGYPENGVRYTGFCRFDGLHRYTNKKQILVMPTWRSWLSGKNLLDSDYYNAYYSLLNSKELYEVLETNDLNLIFYPHHEIQPYIDKFVKLANNRIVVAAKNKYDVQDLLKESLLLITDYSSVFFDFAYMYKPMIFYQFDLMEYRKEHYAQGYFIYNDSFGPVVTTQDALLKSIRNYISTNFVMETNYMDNAKSYFILHDNKNCQRVFDSIEYFTKTI